MPKLESHPSVDELSAFNSGQLLPSQAEAVESHISECTPCCETLMGLSSDDTFIGLLKESQDSDNHTTLDEALAPLDYSLTTSDETARSVLAKHPRYEIIAPIAKGGMGEVFKAKHLMMDRDVAIKVINNELMRNREAIERFQREVKAAAQLSHPNIVTAFDAEQAEGVHFLVMEYVDGVNLAELVEKKGKLSIQDACEYTRQAAIGLQHAYEQGMVHRDMKPHNLMLAADGTIKILDFGLTSLASKSVVTGKPELAERAHLTTTGTVMGTPNFISPEQATDAHLADIRSDIYSLGATLHYLLSGKAPFAEGTVAERLHSHQSKEATPITSLREDASPELSDLVNQMMSKDPEQRFQTPREVADALTPLLSTTSASSSVGKSTEPPIKRIALTLASFAFIVASIFYVQTDNGTLIIDSTDPNVTITISKAKNETGGSALKMQIIDTLTGSEVKRLPSGEYVLSLAEERSEFELSQAGFTLSRGNEVIVKVTRKAKEEPIEILVPPMDLPDRVQRAFLTKGLELPLEEVKKLRIKTASDPNDIASRLQLIGFYYFKGIQSSEMRLQHQNLVVWLINNYPASEAASAFQARFISTINPEGYMEVKKIWLEHLGENSQDISILCNAADYFRSEESQFAEKLFKEAQAIEPNNPDVAHKLGYLYELALKRLSGDKRQEQAAKAMKQYEIAIKHRERPNIYWHADLAEVALEANSFDQAKLYAQQLLDLSDEGRSIHEANIVLGKVAFQAKDLEQAKSYLLASGRVKGGTKLNRFDPDMALAKKLLEKEEWAAVLEYFELCRNFWKETEKLDEWTEAVKNKQIPNFDGKKKAPRVSPTRSLLDNIRNRLPAFSLVPATEGKGEEKSQTREQLNRGQQK